MRTFKITSPDEALRPQIQEKIDNLNKPKGSLGRLEELAMQICLIQQTLSPSLAHPCHLLLGGDHGIIDKKVARGTLNFLYEPAMTAAQFDEAIEVGASLVDDCVSEGCRILCIGEMGIANTSPSSIWMHLFCKIPLEECIGAGAGLNMEGIRHKYDVLSQAISNYHKCKSGSNFSTLHSSLFTLSYFGGFEMVAAIGAMLRAAEQHLVILVDGFIMTACALAAIQLEPKSRDYMIFTHSGDEVGHRKMLDAMGASPLVSLGLRLGEGTGALCAFPIVDSAVRMVNEMNNFQNASITKYF